MTSHPRTKIEYKKLVGDDAEKLWELFGIEDCLVEVHPSGILMPPQYKDIAERILDSPVYADDIWLVSLPRTGSTWAQEMVWCIGNDLDFEKAKINQLVRVSLIEWTAIMDFHHKEYCEEQVGNSVDHVENLPRPRFIKSHLNMDLLPTQLHTVKPKIVYVARNPKDMCVSYYHLCKLAHGFKGTFEEFSELFIKDKVPLGPIFSNILSFWNRRNEPNILFLKYEDMKRDQAGAIRQTAEFLGKVITEADVERLTEYLSFNKMKENPAVNWKPLIEKTHGENYMENTGMSFIRKGQVGDWKNHMSPELVARFDKWSEDNLAGTGLSFD